MSDYTPTTEEVLTHYLALPEDRPEVERWLYEERNRMAGVGAELERERIIKLLEEELQQQPYNSVLRRLEAGIRQMPFKPAEGENK